MKTILHIGMAKTGSTALQRSLKQSHDVLLSKGLLFPENPPGSRYANHKSLLPGIFQVRDLPRHLLRGRPDDVIKGEYHAFRAHLDVQLADQHPKGLILSTESLFRPITGEAAQRFQGIFRDIKVEPHVVAYLRRPSAYYLSGLQQHLKASWKIREPRQAKYQESLHSYLDMFGSDKISLYVFDRSKLINGDIVADFVTRHLSEWSVVPSDLKPPEKSNETMCGEAMDLVRLYRRRFHAERDNFQTRDSAGLVKALQLAGDSLGAGRPQLRAGIADLIDYSTTELLWIRDQFGLIFDDYDYARLERGDLLTVPERDWQLADIIQIDRDLQASLAQHVAESAWADADPARKAWALEQARAPGENEALATIDFSATLRRKKKVKSKSKNKRAITPSSEPPKVHKALPWFDRVLRRLKRLKPVQTDGQKSRNGKSGKEKDRNRLQ